MITGTPILKFDFVGNEIQPVADMNCKPPYRSNPEMCRSWQSVHWHNKAEDNFFCMFRSVLDFELVCFQFALIIHFSRRYNATSAATVLVLSFVTLHTQRRRAKYFKCVGWGPAMATITSAPIYKYTLNRPSNKIMSNHFPSKVSECVLFYCHIWFNTMCDISFSLS